MNLALGVDIGGTNVRVAVVETGGGTILESERAVLAGTSVEQVEATVVRLVKTLEGVLPLAGVPVGVGFAGMLKGGVVVNAPNLGWRDVEFGERLGRALGRPVRLLNDLTVAAFGEFWAGAARGSTDSFTVFAGTGVGSAIISEGRIVHGATGVAGEFGHVKVVAEGGRPCGCGGEGCLEAYAGGARLLAWMKEEGLEGTVTELEAQAEAGSPKARALYDFAAGALALAIANQVTVLNPQVVVLGGGVLMHAPGMVQRIRHTIARRTCAPARAAVRVELAKLGDDSGIVGAALLARA